MPKIVESTRINQTKKQIKLEEALQFLAPTTTPTPTTPRARSIPGTDLRKLREQEQNEQHDEQPSRSVRALATAGRLGALAHAAAGVAAAAAVDGDHAHAAGRLHCGRCRCDGRALGGRWLQAGRVVVL